MSTTISDSLVSKVALREFSEAECGMVMELLSRYGQQRHHLEQNRVRLAMRKLAKGDITILERQVKVAYTDFRDVLAAAEMPRQYSLGFTGIEQLPPPPRA
jgi:hypothetical protein